MMRFFQRRSSRDRRDWDIFHYPERRSGQHRRTGKDRRQADTPYHGSERRRAVEVVGEVTSPRPVPSTPPPTPPPEERYYSTAEVAEITGLSQPTLLLWIRNKIIDASHIKRSVEGRRLWTREDIEQIERVKARNGWVG